MPVTRRQRYGALLLTTLCLLGVQGVAPPGAVVDVVVAALAGLSLLLAFRAAAVAPWLARAAGALAALGVLLSILRASGAGVGDAATRLVNATLVGVGPPVIALGVMRDLRASREVRLQALAGVISLYLLLGMLFAFLYGAIDVLGGRGFFAGGEPASASNCLYFSFTTLTTVGYGDFTAGAELGRTLSILEALVGQIYLVTVVSLIVSNIGRRPAPPSPPHHAEAMELLAPPAGAGPPEDAGRIS
jgi:hypothetical protein